MQIPDVRYVRNGDVALAYQVFGEGPLDIVSLPAFANNIAPTTSRSPGRARTTPASSGGSRRSRG
jgi:hypothetical protein